MELRSYDDEPGSNPRSLLNFYWAQKGCEIIVPDIIMTYNPPQTPETKLQDLKNDMNLFIDTLCNKYDVLITSAHWLRVIQICLHVNKNFI